MAVPTFVGAGDGWLVATGNANGTKTGVTVGNLIIVQVLVDAGAASALTLTTTDSSLENLAGTTNALTVADSANFTGGGFVLSTGRALSTTVTVNAATTGADLYCRIYEFAGASTGTTLATVFEGSSSVEGSTAAINDRGVTTTAADRLALNFVYVDDDNAVDAFTGMTGGTWVEAVAEYATATGTDGCIQLQTADMPSAGTIDGGSYTMAAADNWVIVGKAIIPGAPAATPTLFYVTA